MRVFVRSTLILLGATALSTALSTALLAGPIGAAKRKLTPAITFAMAQHCRINGTVDLGCFQQNHARFEFFVLQDEAAWLPKFIVAESLVKYYDSMHVDTEAAQAVRAKYEIYTKANLTLDKSELGQIDDCKDENNPDSCLNSRYCFKEAYIKVKNVLVTNSPEKFEAEIRWFDKEVKGNCQM
jgi:hypothetical protein